MTEPFDDALVEDVARKLAGQYMVDDGYGEHSRADAEAGEMWRNFKGAARAALAVAVPRIRAQCAGNVVEQFRDMMLPENADKYFGKGTQQGESE